MRKQFICKNLDESITDCFNTGDIIEGVLSGASISEVTGIKIQSKGRVNFLKERNQNGVFQYSVPLSGLIWLWEEYSPKK